MGWDRAEYGLDFIQVHSYPDERHPDRDASLFGRPAEALGVSKPVLIGEFPGAHLGKYRALARDGGYLGAWPWSFKALTCMEPWASMRCRPRRRWKRQGRID